VKERIILLGPPASGKGTQASRMSKAFGIPHVSTGALLRSEASLGTELGREADRWTRGGSLVPDGLVIRVVGDWIAANGPRFLFDGFPRTVGQAKSLDELLRDVSAPLDLVILLELDPVEIRGRIMDRLTCRGCGETYGGSLHGLENGGSCPTCGGKLARRSDDTEDVLAERLRAYCESTLPVVAHYESTNPGILHRVDAAQGSDAIYSVLSALVDWEMQKAE